MTDTPKHSVSVAGIVVDDQDRVLAIQRRDNGHWEPPGGVLELDETPEQGVRREILEETGVDVQVDRLTGIYKNMSRGIVALVFRCHQVGGVEATTDESMRVAWLDHKDVTTSMLPAYAIRAQDALQVADFPAVRAHDGRDLIQATVG